LPTEVLVFICLSAFEVSEAG